MTPNSTQHSVQMTQHVRHKNVGFCLPSMLEPSLLFVLQVLEALDRLATFEMAFGIENFRFVCLFFNGVFRLG